MHTPCYFLLVFSDDSKQDTVTTCSHSKRIIKLLNQRQIMSLMFSTTREKMYGYNGPYSCTMALYLFSMLSKAYNNIIGLTVSAPENDREVVYVLDATEESLSLS